MSGDLNKYSAMLKRIKSALVIALPASAGEAIQHAVEINFGMYAIGDGISAGHETNMRYFAAAVKVLGFLTTVALARSHTRRNSCAKSATMSQRIVIATSLILHYGINYLAVGRSELIVAVLVIIDCLVIGCLAFAIGSILQGRSLLDKR